MSEAAAPNHVSISINGVALDVPAGELIVEAAKRIGVEIPIFCYHPRMKPVGMCRMCLVEVGFQQQDGSVRKMPKPQTACSLPAMQGMVVFTDTTQVHKDRKGVLEFLLANHPLDCPVCDRGGECPLQNNTIFYGPSTSRFVEAKRHAHKAFPLSEYVMLDLERCIQCARCVRFTEEISGDSQLAFRFRGASMQPATFRLTEFESKFSGNVIEICPVGALTNSKYRFRARPWDLETSPGICTQCSNGCSVWFDHRVGKLVRTNGRINEQVNEEWTCDRGKFGQEFHNENRLMAPLVRDVEAMREASWSGAYRQVLEQFTKGGGAVAGLVKPKVSNEGLYLFKKLFDEVFASPNLDHRWTACVRQESPDEDWTPTAIADLERMKTIVVFGEDLSDAAPIVYLRVRKAWSRNGAKVVVVSSKPTDVDRFAHLVVRTPEGGEADFAQNLVESANEQARAIRSLMEEGPACMLVPRSLLGVPEGARAVGHLESLARQTGVALNLLAMEANEQGALDLGVLPGKGGMCTAEILTAAAEGSLKALWLVECDPIRDFPDQELAVRALQNVGFLVYSGVNECEAALYANVVLPMAAPAEQEGTYTNVERRVQRMSQALRPPGQAKPSWRIFSECMILAQPSTPAFRAGEVFAEIQQKVPLFAGVQESDLWGEGSRLLARAPLFGGR